MTSEGIQNICMNYQKNNENLNIEVIQDPPGGTRYVIKNIEFTDSIAFFEIFKSFKGETVFLCFDSCNFEQFGFGTIYYQQYLKDKIEFVNCTFKAFNINNFNTDKCRLELNNLFFGNEDRSNKIESLSINSSLIEEELLFDTTFFNYSLKVNKLIIQENSKLTNLKILNQDMINLIIKDSNIKIFNFNKSTVKESGFQNVQFEGVSSFIKSEFKNIVIFDNVDFKEFTNFSNSTFCKGLNLDNTNIEKDISFLKMEI